MADKVGSLLEQDLFSELFQSLQTLTAPAGTALCEKTLFPDGKQEFQDGVRIDEDRAEHALLGFDRLRCQLVDAHGWFGLDAA